MIPSFIYLFIFFKNDMLQLVCIKRKASALMRAAALQRPTPAATDVPPRVSAHRKLFPHENRFLVAPLLF